MSDLPYFADTDFKPYLNKTFDYLLYVGPIGSGSNDHDRYCSELEEYVLIEIKPHILVMEHKGSYPVAETQISRKYTDVMLVPISQIVEFRISTYLEDLPDEPKAADD